jgi:hypothetical protein
MKVDESTPKANPLVAELADILKASGMRPSALCAILKINQGTLHNTLTGKRQHPSIDRVMAIADALGYDVVLKKRKEKK